ncbi:MAG: 2-oxoglutarate ferredoxin oxidoreductase subunit alpha [Fusobacteria bacterium]|nr:MAG: 2-oxoglutarate ferredoxin oxidoreductase subunit alpha [Fusobacteriota bacterium]KAF0229137.1 MAG: 2-oxoglutarate ferredoxin oxidoreductase subunit [Fusobacteriota bacterium]
MKAIRQVFEWSVIYMKEITVLIAGRRGDGLDDTGLLVSNILSRIGYQIYMYNDIPSLIIGGHQFVLVRGANEKISAHKDKVDIVLAYNQDAIDNHKNRFNEKTIIISDKDKVQVDDPNLINIGLSLKEIIEDKALTIQLSGICLVAGLCKTLNIELSLLEDIIKKNNPKFLEQKLKAAKIAYEKVNIKNDQIIKEIKEKSKNEQLPILSGSEAIGLGLLKAGLEAYIAYPMTPTSPILEFLAANEKELGLHVVLPESEIAVMLMALGYSYMGVRNAVGTSGGGFSLMVEALGLSGQAELPAVIVMGQRSGPSTGMPTYTAQTDLHFVLNASQGEFPRLIVAPGDAEEAYYWSGVAMNKAWKYQMPAIILTDKTLGLGYYSFDASLVPEVKVEEAILWDRQGQYSRYKMTNDGISPIAFPSIEGQAIKATSYTHNEYGITTEDPKTAKALADKLIMKEKQLANVLENYETVKVYGEGRTALLCWGTNKGVCLEVARKYNLKVVQMIVMSPFPTNALTRALEGVDRLISVECNAKGQLAILLKQKGFNVDELILKYDGRPFSVDDLDLEVKKVMA